MYVCVCMVEAEPVAECSFSTCDLEHTKLMLKELDNFLLKIAVFHEREPCSVYLCACVYAIRGVVYEYKRLKIECMCTTCPASL